MEQVLFDPVRPGRHATISPNSCLIAYVTKSVNVHVADVTTTFHEKTPSTISGLGDTPLQNKPGATAVASGQHHHRGRYVALDDVTHLSWSPDSTTLLVLMQPRGTIELVSAGTFACIGRIDAGINGLYEALWHPSSRCVYWFGLARAFCLSLLDGGCMAFEHPVKLVEYIHYSSWAKHREAITQVVPVPQKPFSSGQTASHLRPVSALVSFSDDRQFLFCIAPCSIAGTPGSPSNTRPTTAASPLLDSSDQQLVERSTVVGDSSSRKGSPPPPAFHEYSMTNPMSSSMIAAMYPQMTKEEQRAMVDWHESVRREAALIPKAAADRSVPVVVEHFNVYCSSTHKRLASFPVSRIVPGVPQPYFPDEDEEEGNGGEDDHNPLPPLSHPRDQSPAARQPSDRSGTPVGSKVAVVAAAPTMTASSSSKRTPSRGPSVPLSTKLAPQSCCVDQVTWFQVTTAGIILFDQYSQRVAVLSLDGRRVIRSLDGIAAVAVSCDRSVLVCVATDVTVKLLHLVSGGNVYQMGDVFLQPQFLSKASTPVLSEVSVTPAEELTLISNQQPARGLGRIPRIPPEAFAKLRTKSAYELEPLNVQSFQHYTDRYLAMRDRDSIYAKAYFKFHPEAEHLAALSMTQEAAQEAGLPASRAFELHHHELVIASTATVAMAAISPCGTYLAAVTPRYPTIVFIVDLPSTLVVAILRHKLVVTTLSWRGDPHVTSHPQQLANPSSPALVISTDTQDGVIHMWTESAAMCVSIPFEIHSSDFTSVNNKENQQQPSQDPSTRAGGSSKRGAVPDVGKVGVKIDQIQWGANGQSLLLCDTLRDVYCTAVLQPPQQPKKGK